MSFIKKILLLAFMILPTAGFAASMECKKYTDCDSMVACELYSKIIDAQSGLSVNFDFATAKAIMSLPNCAGYENKFKHNISETIENIKIDINWATVRKIIQNGGTVTPDETTGEMATSELVDLIVKVLGPDTKEQETFFQALATEYVAANQKDETTHLDDAFVINFLGDNDPQLSKYKTALTPLTGTITEQELGIDIDWDAILEEISEVLDQVSPKYGALVCENNRSWQGAIDALGWIVTAVAAIGTFYTGGAGGAAVAAGRAALGAGLKASARALAKVGGKAAAKRLSKQGGKQLAKSAVKLGLKTNMRGWNNYVGKGVLRAGIKNYAKIAGKNLSKKWVLLSGAGALVYWGGKGNAGTGYSLLSSDADKEIVNCQDLDHNEGCYTVCGDSPTGWKGTLDMLNQHVLQPITGKKYCVNETDYQLYEITANNGIGAKLIIDADQLKQLRSKIKLIQDKRPCDYNEDDIDMYIGSFVHDPDKLDISTEGMIIQDLIRIDD